MVLQKLKYFIEVAEQRSLTKAAKALYISQPALSKQMKLLEQELGFPLFNRSVRGVEFTQKGLGLYQELAPLFSQIDRTIHQYMHQDKIRFGSTPFLSTYLLHELYDKLQHPNFHVTAIKDDSQDLLPLLESQEIDAAIIQDVPSYRNLYSKFLFRDDFKAAIPVSSPLASKMEVTLDECLSETQIIPPEGPLSSQVRKILQDKEFVGEIMEAHYHAMVGLVSLGIGIAYIPNIMVEQIEYKGVVFLPIKDTPFKREMYLYAVSPSILDFLAGKFID